MPYSTEYSEEKYKDIEGYLAQLALLEEGKVLSISTPSPEEGKRLRWLFYDYFHITAAEGKFKANLYGNFLFIGNKKPTLSNITTITRKANITKQLDSLVEELIASPTPRLLASLFIRDESISFSSLVIALGEYARVMGE